MSAPLLPNINHNQSHAGFASADAKEDAGITGSKWMPPGWTLERLEADGLQAFDKEHGEWLSKNGSEGGEREGEGKGSCR